ncbi:MAG: tetratricopeptide repeat protein [Chloroflexota bacterium]
MVEVAFGEWLKRQRSGRGLTQEQLAHQIGCAAITLRKIESEERRPSEQIVERLAEIFNIPKDEQTKFLRYARGDWQAAPTDGIENTPWLVSDIRADRSNSKIHLATFLFTDIEGSAKLWDQSPEKMKAALQRHHEILQEAITSNGGAVFQIVGDAFCAAFPTVLSAISAAMIAQQGLYQEQWDLPFPMRVRMGIHTGEAEQTSDNPLLGGYASNQTLNRVARILSAAHGGQILLSLATTDLIKDSLSPNTELRDMGEHHLRNLIHPEHFFQLNISGLPSDFPPLNTLTHRHNLPIQMTSFIGRENEKREIEEAINHHRLVTLTGSGGTGKTRLSLQVAEDLFKQFEYLWFVELAPVSNPDNIPQTILSVIGLSEQQGKTTQELISGYLQDKKTLLILDNCEHLIEACATISYSLLNHAPELKILASSREALGVKGEKIWHVPSLSLPDLNHLPEFDELVQYEAIRLFTERATLVKPNFTATKENASAIAQTCSRLDGIPLAIELAAARIKALSVDQIAARLDDRFRLLTGGSRTALPRQQTLRATIDWSYNLLSEPERALLRRLTVFSGGWKLEAAESVYSEAGSDLDAFDLLSQLVDKSLVSQNDSRYRLLETTRQYAHEKLLDSGEDQALRNRHLSYFLDLAKQADKEIHGPHQVEWLDILETEHDNYRAALDWCITSGNFESALYLIGSFSDLGRFWSVRGYFSEARNWFNKVSTSPDITLYPLAYATALNGISFIAFLQSDFVTAHTLAEESQRICEPLGKDGELGLAGALLAIGLATLNWDNATIARVKTCFEQAAAIYQAHGYQWELAFALFRQGVVARICSNHAKAQLFLEDSLRIFRKLDDAFGLGRVYREMGSLFSEQGDYHQARRMYEQGLSYDKKLHFQHAMSTSLDTLGILCRMQGDYDQAEVYLEESSMICREFNLSDDVSPFYLGCVNLHRREYTAAKTRLIEFIKINHKLGIQYQVGEGLIGLAAVAAGLHQYDRAARLAGAGQAVHDAIAFVTDPNDRIEIGPLLQIAREQLGDIKFEELTLEGHSMTMEQAIAYAFEE